MNGKNVNLLAKMIRFGAVLILFAALAPGKASAASSMTSLRLLYPSFAGSWATAWIAKEAGYFANEGLDVELIRVGGSTRMVAAMLGGSAPIIQAGASAGLAGTAAGSTITRPDSRSAAPSVPGDDARSCPPRPPPTQLPTGR